MSEFIGDREVIQRHSRHGGGSQRPKRIIVHAMAYQLDYKGERLYAATFLERIGLSAHLLVAPDGTPIRCRRDDEIAWHAKGFNQDSLGVEVLIPGVYNYDRFVRAIDEPWVRQRQFITTVAAVREWCERWGIEPVPDQLDRHSDVDPERKHDPGEGFPWDKLVERVSTGEAVA